MSRKTKPTPPPEEEVETEEDVAFKFSQLLKRSHDERSSLLVKDDTLSEHILREAERAGLDPCMLLWAYLAATAHVLNPCARATAAPLRHAR